MKELRDLKSVSPSVSELGVRVEGLGLSANRAWNCTRAER